MEVLVFEGEWKALAGSEKLDGLYFGSSKPFQGDFLRTKQLEFRGIR